MLMEVVLVTWLYFIVGFILLRHTILAVIDEVENDSQPTPTVVYIIVACIAFTIWPILVFRTIWFNINR